MDKQFHPTNRIQISPAPEDSRGDAGNQEDVEKGFNSDLISIGRGSIRESFSGVTTFPSSIHLTTDASKICCLFSELLNPRIKVLSSEPVVETGIDDLYSARDLREISRGMMYYLKIESTEEAAINRFMQRFPSMRELDERHKFFRKSLELACSRILSDQQRYAKIR